MSEVHLYPHPKLRTYSFAPTAQWYFAHKKRPPPLEPPRTLGIGLR